MSNHGTHYGSTYGAADHVGAQVDAEGGDSAKGQPWGSYGAATGQLWGI